MTFALSIRIFDLEWEILCKFLHYFRLWCHHHVHRSFSPIHLCHLGCPLSHFFLLYLVGYGCQICYCFENEISIIIIIKWNAETIKWTSTTNLDCGDARSFCTVSASVGAVEDALLDGLWNERWKLLAWANNNKATTKKLIYRCRLFGAFSALPRDPSRKTLWRSCSLNGLRWFRLRVASYGRYICGRYGVKPANPELLGFINESHSCFIVFNGTATSPELFLWCLRSWSCDCDCAAAKRPCSVDKPLTWKFKWNGNRFEKWQNKTEIQFSFRE